MHSNVKLLMRLKKTKILVGRAGELSGRMARRAVNGVKALGLVAGDAFRRLRLRPAWQPTGKKRIVYFAAAVLLAAAGFGVLANRIVAHKSSADMYRNIDAVPRRYTAIVLGARVYSDHTPSPILEDRLRCGLDLYRKGKVKKILVSGDHAAATYDEVNSMYLWMREHGVPEKDIFLDHAGLRTLDTMARAAKVFEVNDAVVCTQAFHLPRSVFLAKKSGIDAVGMVADKRRYRHHQVNMVREFVARTVSVLDVYVFNRGPTFLGDPISIHGDGRLSHDTNTCRVSMK